MHVGLVPRVEDDRVLGGAEHAMQANRQLNDTEVRAEVAPVRDTLSIKKARICAAN